MLFILGYIAGLITAVLIVAALAFFRVGLERKIKFIQTTLENAGPRPQGFVVEPEDEAELARQAHIEKNRREGRDTRIEELM